MDASLPSLPSQTWLLEAMLAATSIGEVVNFEEMDYAVRNFFKGVIVNLYICMHWLWNKGLPIF